jgi:Do/DeqQ family serine protease
VNYSPIDNSSAGWSVSTWRRIRRTLAVATALSLPVALWSATGSQTPAALAAAPVPVAAPASASDRVVGAGQDSYAPIVDAVAPAVVTIRAEQRMRPVRQQLPFADDPLFREFFGNRIPLPDDEDAPAPRAQGLGSGVIVGHDGHILTNHHVIDGADRIRVELKDGRTFTAKVVGSDAPSDLAVLKVEAANLPSIPLGNSDDVRVGDVVLAVGNPMGVGQTVTLGIVSAKGRATGLGNGSFEDFIQTDAAINRGNSGGALVSTRGELIGINSQILSPSGGNIGIGFAIPANMARHVMDSLVTSGQVHRGMLGVGVQGVTPEIASSLGMSAARGALVTSVSANGPASKAGLQRGDVITSIDGHAVRDSNDLRNRIASSVPGTTVRLDVLRNGKTQTISATLAELPAEEQASGAPGADPSRGGALGLNIEPLTGERARALGLTEGQGLLVASVVPGSPAADAGFRRGDVVELVNGQPPRSAAELRDAVAKAGDRPALILVRRGDQSIYLTLSPNTR